MNYNRRKQCDAFEGKHMYARNVKCDACKYFAGFIGLREYRKKETVFMITRHKAKTITNKREKSRAHACNERMNDRNEQSTHLTI